MGVQERNVLHIFCLLLLPFLVHTLEQEAVKVLDAFQRDCLDAHNTYRSQHGVQPLVWSQQLAQHAQNWADQLASRDEVKHDLTATNKLDEGENLAFFHPAVPKCQGSMEGNCVLCREMIQRWYDEGKNFDYDAGRSKTPERITKHFSQIIWANTSEVGIGTSVSKKFGFITVARYSPRGNRGGADMFVLNVPPEGGPLPSLSSDSLKVNNKSVTSTTPTGNGIPVTASHPKKMSEGKKGVLSESPSFSSVPKISTPSTGTPNTEAGLSNIVAGSLGGAAMEQIQPKTTGEFMNDEAEIIPPEKIPNLLSLIVDLANKTKQANKNKNQDVANSKPNQNGSKNSDSSSSGNADQGGQNGQEESSLDHVKDFSYENAAAHRDSIHSTDGENGKDSLQSTTDGIAGSRINGDHGNDDVAIEYEETQNEMGNKGGENAVQGDKRDTNNKVTPATKPLNNGLNIHSDNGIIAGSDIEKDLQNRGLVRTVKGPDGSNAQVFLTKNGGHAGLVFRDQISRVSQENKNDDSLGFDSLGKRVINVL